MTYQDEIRRDMVLSAPIERVWAAITQPEQLSKWFGTHTQFDGLKAGAAIVFGWGDDHFRGVIEEVSPPNRFVYRWNSYHKDSSVPFETLPTTRVTFTLNTVPEGTRLLLVESGFNSLPKENRAKDYQDNSTGWTAELNDLREYLEAAQA